MKLLYGLAYNEHTAFISSFPYIIIIDTGTRGIFLFFVTETLCIYYFYLKNLPRMDAL